MASQYEFSVCKQDLYSKKKKKKKKVVCLTYPRIKQTPYIYCTYSDRAASIYSVESTLLGVWAWVTEYMQVSMLVNTMLCFNKRYLHIFNHPRLYPSIGIHILPCHACDSHGTGTEGKKKKKQKEETKGYKKKIKIYIYIYI